MLVVASTVIMSGCSQNELLLTGIGETVYSPEAEARAETPDKYFGAMCLAAPELYYLDTAGQPHCHPDLTPYQWKMVLFASLNDVDERCDAYLGSLDRARRDQAYFTRKLQDTTSTTKVVMGFAEAGATAMTVVESMFGFSQSTLNNYYSRRILDTGKKSVEELVSKLQNAYREELFARLKNRSIDRSVGVYYAVRGYIRLCLPATIEAEINSTIVSVKYVVGERVAVPDRSPVLASLDAIPLIPGSSGGDGGSGGNGGHGGQDPSQPTTPRPIPSEKIIGPHPASTTEQAMSLARGKEIQAALCISPQDGDFGGADETKPTRIQISWYYQGINRGKHSYIEQDADSTAISSLGTCFTNPRRYLNAFERARFGSTPGKKTLHKRLQVWFDKNKTNPQIDPIFAGAAFGQKEEIDEQTRAAIKLAQKLNGTTETGAMTPEFFDLLKVD
ncbi:hypothetical protein [Hyphomicrobium album]|nr:hypothetical protein [Hyphomicrobium album]